MFKAAVMVVGIVLAAAPAVAQQQPTKTRDHTVGARVQSMSKEERERFLQEKVRDPAFTVPIFSAAVCAGRIGQKAAKDAIQAEKSLARLSGGGVVDLGRVRELQLDFGRALGQERFCRKALMTLAKRKPLPCSAPLVRDLVPCVTYANDLVERGKSCDDPKLQPYLEVERMFFEQVPEDPPP